MATCSDFWKLNNLYSANKENAPGATQSIEGDKQTQIRGTKSQETAVALVENREKTLYSSVLMEGIDSS